MTVVGSVSRFLIVLLSIVLAQQARAQLLLQGITLADFEGGLDPRGSIGYNPAGLRVDGPFYAWEQPSSPAGDDINYWDIYSNQNNVDDPVDYELNFPAQDWRGYSVLQLSYYAWRDDGAGHNIAYDGKIRVYAYDQSGVGNSDGNGFHWLGDHQGGGAPAFDLSSMANRAHVIKLKIRVLESFFGGVASYSQWLRQRTHLFSIRLQGSRLISIPNPNPVNPSGALDMFSQYSPFVMHEAGWDRYRMYFGRNTYEPCPANNCAAKNGCHADRIYLSENFGDGLTGWTSPILVLRPDDSTAKVGERGLIHDPAVVWVPSTGLWHMYYTGIDDLGSGDPTNPNADCSHVAPGSNAIFHAISSDGVSWNRAPLKPAIVGVPFNLASGSFGYGVPSVLYENGIYRLYFGCDAPGAGGSVFLAESTDGDGFTFVGPVAHDIFGAEVRHHNSEYVLVGQGGTGGTTSILTAVSADHTSFPVARPIFSLGPASSWDAFNTWTPSFLPGEDRIYYAGAQVGNGFSGSYPNTIGVVVLNSSTKFFALTPCRLLDTRNPTGPYGGPALSGSVPRIFQGWNQCGIPSNAKSLATNVTIVQPSTGGSLSIAPAGQLYPSSSAISFRAGAVRANNGLIGLIGPTPGSFTIFNNLPIGQASHVLVDVSGYFAPTSDADVGR